MLEKELEILTFLKSAKTYAEVIRKFNINRAKLNALCKRYNVFIPNRPYCDNIKLTHLEEQIILSGIIGDGYLQKRDFKHRDSTFLYRECHAMGEMWYCAWKFIKLHRLTHRHTLYGKNRNDDRYSDGVELCTVQGTLLKPYYYMSKMDIIKKLDDTGLILLLLDDGWYSDNSKNGRFLVSGGSLNNDELMALSKQYSKYGLSNNIIGIKRHDISIESKNNFVVMGYMYKVFGTFNLDIIKKKTDKYYGVLQALEKTSKENTLKGGV